MDILRQLFWLLSRMTTATFLLLLLAVASISGTLVFQGAPTENYSLAFGDFWAPVFLALGLHHVYATWWFLGCTAILLGSVIACLWVNSPQTWRALVAPLPKRAPSGEELVISEEAYAAFLKIVTYSLAKVKKDANGHVVQVRLGTLNRLGYFLTHSAVVGVAAAGLLTGLLGYRGIVNLTEGQERHHVLVPQSGGMHIEEIPFKVINKGFTVEYYQSGLPKHYETKLEIKAAQTPAVEKLLAVNKPISFGAYTLYQSDFGDAGSKVALLHRNLNEAGQAQFVQGRIHEVYADAHTAFELTDYQEQTSAQVLDKRTSMVPQNYNDGAVMDYIVRTPERRPVLLRSYKNYPDIIGLQNMDESFSPVYLGLSVEEDAGWDVVAAALTGIRTYEKVLDGGDVSVPMFARYTENLLKNYPEAERVDVALKSLQAVRVLITLDVPALLHVQGAEPRLYSGLQISYDPGATLFWISSVLLIIGTLCMVYFPHGTVYCVERVSQGKGVRLKISRNRHTARIKHMLLEMDNTTHDDA